ncbi:MAG: histidine phosphatase family protein [Planctomycetota bacterium]|nr:histidine phosphatase family protein [Planctomycetota bacterium]
MDHDLEVLIARHGFVGRDGQRRVPDPRWALDDPRLRPIGRRQAERLGRRLAEDPDGPPGQIVASPLWRTAETAQLVAEALDLRFRVDAGLMEICHPRMLGVFQGLQPREAELLFDRLENPDALEGRWWPHEAETGAGCCARVALAMERMLDGWRRDGLRRILLVGHGGSTDAALDWLTRPGASGRGHDLCGLSQVLLPGGRRPGELLRLNCQRHLEAEPQLVVDSARVH